MDNKMMRTAQLAGLAVCALVLWAIFFGPNAYRKHYVKTHNCTMYGGAEGRLYYDCRSPDVFVVTE